jgi:hypothetical protein
VSVAPNRVRAGQLPLPIITAGVDGPVLLVNRGSADVFLGDSTVGPSNNAAILPPLASMVVQGDAGPWWVVADITATTPQEVEVIPYGIGYQAGAVEIAEQLLSSGILVVDAPVSLGSGTAVLTSGAPFVLALTYTDISRYNTLILRMSAVNDIPNNDNTVIAQTLFYADNTSGIDCGYTITDVRTGLETLGLAMPARAKYAQLSLFWTQRQATVPNHTVTVTWELIGSYRASQGPRLDRREPTIAQSDTPGAAVVVGTPFELSFVTISGDVDLYLEFVSAAAGTFTPSIEAEFYSSGTPRTRTLWKGAPLLYNGGLLYQTIKFPRRACRLLLTPSANALLTNIRIGAVADPSFIH